MKLPKNFADSDFMVFEVLIFIIQSSSTYEAWTLSQCYQTVNEGKVINKGC